MTRNDITDTTTTVEVGAGDAQVIADLAAQAAPTQTVVVDGYATLVVGHGPDGPKVVHQVDHVTDADYPAAKRGQLALHTPASLADYAARHTHLDRTTIWGDLPAGKITVVLNDHSDLADDTAGWADHRAAVQLRRTPEWEAWTGIHEKPLGQVELAEFLEEHLLDVTEPDGSALLDIVQTFQATSSARFKKSVVLHSGEQQLTWEETIDATAGAGSTEIPRQLTIRIAPWMGVAPVDITAAFRFRLRDGRLTLSVVLRNLQQHSDQGVIAAVEEVAATLELPALYGTPPALRR